MSARQRKESTLAACVRPLLEALGWRGNEASLAEIISPSKTSWRLVELLQRFEVLGYVAKSGRVPRRKSVGLSLPLLLLDKHGVWTVVGPNEEPEAVRKRWRGRPCLSFSTPPPHATTKVSPFWLQDLLAEHRGALGLALVFSFVLALFGMLSPQFIGMLYQEITSMSNPVGLWSLGIGALLFAGGEVTFLALRQLLLNSLSRQTGDVLSREVVRRILYFPLALSMNVGPQAQLARVREFEDLARLVSQPIFRSMLDLPFVALLLVSLALLGGLMVIVPLVVIVLFLLLSVVVLPLIRKADQDAATEASAVASKLEAVLEHADELRVLGIDAYWAKNLDASERKAMPSALGRSHTSSVYQSTSAMLVSVAGVLAVVLGVGEVLAGRLQPGALLASMMLIWRILDPFRAVFVLVGSIQATLQSFQRLQKFMAIAGEQKPDQNRPALTMESFSVKAEGFYFKYPQSLRFALANVSFTVEDRKALHIAGSAGSGRSTLCEAILGLVEGYSGRILVGEQNVRQYNSISFRKLMNYLPRQVPVLPLYLKDNLLLAKPEASDEELWAALDEASLGATVRALPHGLDTKLDESFATVRADFHRCLGIARLLLRGPGLWLLDEPEEGLGLEARRHLLEALRRRKGSVTLILFTNDPEFAALADDHGELDQGRYMKVTP